MKYNILALLMLTFTTYSFNGYALDVSVVNGQARVGSTVRALEKNVRLIDTKATTAVETAKTTSDELKVAQELINTMESCNNQNKIYNSDTGKCISVPDALSETLACGNGEVVGSVDIATPNPSYTPPVYERVCNRRSSLFGGGLRCYNVLKTPSVGAPNIITKELKCITNEETVTAGLPNCNDNEIIIKEGGALVCKSLAETMVSKLGCKFGEVAYFGMPPLTGNIIQKTLQMTKVISGQSAPALKCKKAVNLCSCAAFSKDGFSFNASNKCGDVVKATKRKGRFTLTATAMCTLDGFKVLSLQ